MDRAQSRSAWADSGRDVRRGRTRPRDGRSAGDRRAGGCRARKHGEDDPGGPDAVAGDHRGHEPGRGPQEPLADGGALDHRGDLHRNSGRHPPVVIAMLSYFDSIDFTPCRRPAMASLTIRKLDEAVKAYLRL